MLLYKRAEREIKTMKKIFATLMMIAMMAVIIPFTASTANAQTRYRDRNYNRPNVYQRHRNVINIAAGTGAGALLGALIGGKKGALIGTAIGAGGSALYTYKINPKDRRYRYYNRRY
jgi:outer membrane lipoprotein SlyB